MASITLAKPDVALWSDIAGTRLAIDTLMMADGSESYDSTAVWFDAGDDVPALPTEYRGRGYSASVQCSARFVGRESGHTARVAFVGLLRAARRATDARLQFRTNAGLAPGFDEVVVGKVSTWVCERAGGQVYDVSFTLDLVASSPEG